MSTIVVADDETEILEATSALLRGLGYSVATIDSAAGILGVLKRERPKLLLQDYRMPGLDLRSEIQLIRGQTSLATVKIVVFTASLVDPSLTRAMGADGFLEKPVDFESLRETAIKYAGPAQP